MNYFEKKNKKNSLAHGILISNQCSVQHNTRL